MARIELKGLSKRFGAVTAVEGIELSIADGEFIVLVGPSGCGKSTTLRMIAGLEDVSAGTITIDGRVVNELAPRQRNIAMVFQNYAIYPHLTVRQNIGFGLYTARLDRTARQQRIEAAAGTLGLGELLDRRPSELSGGQRQRVAIGRAMVREPSAFLFDEPLSNLDAQLRAQMRVEIKRLHRRLGATAVYVTHDQVEAMTMADRIVVMREGRVLQVGTPTELYAGPVDVFTARFIGSPAMNLLRGRPTEGGWVVAGADGVLHGVPTARGEILVGVRPHDLVLTGGQPPAGSLALTGIVDAVEPTGADTLVHLMVDEAEVLATTEGSPPTVGATVTACAPAESIYLFDAATEKALPRR